VSTEPISLGWVIPIVFGSLNRKILRRIPLLADLAILLLRIDLLHRT